MIQIVPAGLTLLALISVGQTGGALVSQRLEGLRRVCHYEDRVHGRLAPPLAVTIGMAEPCPFQYPRRTRPRPSDVPALATLEGETREAGRTVCRYVYMGVRYNRPIQTAQRCPYTPYFAE